MCMKKLDYIQGILMLCNVLKMMPMVMYSTELFVLINKVTASGKELPSVVTCNYWIWCSQVEGSN